MSIPRSVLVTGANRGIGLGLIEAYLKVPAVKFVIGTARDPTAAKELSALNDPRLHVVKMDVLSDDSIKKASEEVSKIVGNDGLNLLINNSGIFEKYGLNDEPNRKTLNKVLETNANSQLIVTQYFLPLLRKAARKGEWGIDKSAIIMMSSGAASIADNKSGGHLAYRMSKAALNQLMKTLAVDLESEGVLVASVAPGHVLTDMGGKNAEITVEESCSDMLKTFSTWNKSHTGGFFRRNGDPFPF